MAQIAYKSAGAGVGLNATTALAPACPATVDAGDVLIMHVVYRGTSLTPSTPANWTLLDGPRNVGTTASARMWVYGKIADGTEDGATQSLGTTASAIEKVARIYSFSGRTSGTITQLVPAASFAATVHANDPQMPTVTTTSANAQAIALVCQSDNNTLGAATGETGGDWTEAVAEYTVALTTGFVIQLQTADPTGNPGTITGGAVAATNDPSGVIGFEILDAPNIVIHERSAALAATGTIASTGTVYRAPYRTAVLADSPTAYWRLDETSGTTAANSSSAGATHNGTYVNTPTLGVSGATSKDTDNLAATFDAAQSERVDTTTLGTLGSSLLTSTWEFWVKTTSTAMGCVAGTVSTGTTLIVQILVNAQNETATADWMTFHVRNQAGTGSWYARVNNADLNDGEWHHVVWRFETAPNMSCYIDGASQTVSYSTSGSGTIGGGNFTHLLSLAARNVRGASWDRYLAGSVDEVAVYPTQLSNERIAAHFEAANGDVTLNVEPAYATGLVAPIYVATGVNLSVAPAAAEGFIAAKPAGLIGTFVIGTDRIGDHTGMVLSVVPERSAALAAATGVETSGTVIPGAGVHSRSAALAGTSDITTGRVVAASRAAALSATAAIIAAGGRAAVGAASLTATTGVVTSGHHDHVRSAAFTGSGGVATSGTIAGVLNRSAALIATTGIAGSGQRVLLRAATATATSSIQTAGSVAVLYTRSVAVNATTTIAAAGEVYWPPPATETHPSLGGVYDETPTGGLIVNGSRGGTVTMTTRGGSLIYVIRGGRTDNDHRSGDYDDTPTGGELALPRGGTPY